MVSCLLHWIDGGALQNVISIIGASCLARYVCLEMRPPSLVIQIELAHARAKYIQSAVLADCAFAWAFSWLIQNTEAMK